MASSIDGTGFQNDRGKISSVRRKVCLLGLTEEVSAIFDAYARTISSDFPLPNLKCSGREMIDRSHLTQIKKGVWEKFLLKHCKTESPNHANNNINSQSIIKGVKRSDAETRDNVITSDDSSSMSTDTRKKLKRTYNPTFFLFTPLRVVLKFFTYVLISVVSLSCLLSLHQPSQIFVSRNTQDFIYPFMRSLRMLSVPVVKQYPVLSDFYEESCLVSNPYYEEDSVDCWPCEDVRHVVDLTGFSNFSSTYHHSGIPFVVKDALHKEISIEEIQSTYISNKHLTGAGFVSTSKSFLATLDDVFLDDSLTQDAKFHVQWTINRVPISRVWRELIPRPYFIPHTTEISVQRYLFIDQVNSSSYRLPLTEFANVFIAQTSGTRSVVLIPTDHCRQACKVVSIILEPRNLLFYNWLFWRPLSVPVGKSHTNISISMMGSFY